MHQRLAETMTFVEEKRRELLQSFEGVPGDRLCRRALPEGWSIAEILEHLRMVETGVARLITKRVGQAREAGLSEEKDASSVLQPFDRHAAYVDSVVLKSAGPVQPRPVVVICQALAGLESLSA